VESEALSAFVWRWFVFSSHLQEQQFAIKKGSAGKKETHKNLKGD
jgi:hypothetical protein